MDQQITREVLTITHKNLTADDKAVGARFNQVAMMGLDQMEEYLVNGPEEYRFAITKSLVSALSRLSATDAEEAITIHREAYMRELNAMTQVEPHFTHAQTEAITVGTDDQDFG